jgi:hypothetical protein
MIIGRRFCTRFDIFFTTGPTKNRRNVVVKWVALLLHMREVPNSNFGPGGPASLLEVFRAFTPSLQANSVMVPQIRQRPLFHVLFNSLFSNSSIRCYIQPELLTAFLNNHKEILVRLSLRNPA